jgi:hypothetical protein
MRYALNLAEDGRILSATYEQYAPEDAVIVDNLPEGDVSEFRYVNGEFVCDPLDTARKEVALERIAELKQYLFDTDYNILKVIEGAATAEEMAEVIAKRAAWRKEINDLERELEK